MNRRIVVPALVVCSATAMGVGAAFTDGATATVLLGVAAFTPIAVAVLPDRVVRKQPAPPLERPLLVVAAQQREPLPSLVAGV